MAATLNGNLVYAITELFFDEDDDIDALLLSNRNNLIPIFRKRLYVPRMDGFVERTVREFVDVDFRMHYRISLDTYTLIVNGIGGELLKVHGGGFERPSPERQILIFLSYMANKESMRQLGLYFGLGTSTVHGILKTVCGVFNRMFIGIIKWPDHAEQQEISKEFYMTCGLRGIVGVLDGSHIRLAHKLGSDNDYINRKGYPSMQLQIVCDHIYSGWPGCAHDARVLRNSSLQATLEADQLHTDCYIIADSAYPLRNNLITPYKDNGRLNQNQRRFNRVLASGRQIVERCIGHLKGRFRHLHELTLHDANDIVNNIVSGCILSNMCILQGGDIEEYIDIRVVDHPNQFVNVVGDRDAGIQRRVQLMGELP